MRGTVEGRATLGDGAGDFGMRRKEGASPRRISVYLYLVIKAYVQNVENLKSRENKEVAYLPKNNYY